MMKKIVLLVFLLSTVTSVLALDCQYKTTEPVTVPRFDFYENGTKLDYALLTIDDFHRHNPGGSRELTEIDSFRVTNNYYDKINVTVTFNSPGPDSETLLIDSKSFLRIKRPETDPISIDENSIMFYIHTESLEAKKESDVILQEACKKCPPPDDFICLNEGVQSDSDEHCGSGRRNVNGICVCSDCPKYNTTDKICNDGKLAENLGENCENSPPDCFCADYEICRKGACVDDENTTSPPIEAIYCSVVNAFRKINAKSQGDPCDCPFECVEHYKNCDLKKCQPEPNNPPKDQKYCAVINNFKPINAVNLGTTCDCDFECKEGVCFQGKCQKIVPLRLTCPSGTSVRKGGGLSCNLVARNTFLNKDVKATFVLDAGNGLAFSESFGCQNIKGSQCIGTYTIAQLSNEGVEVKLDCLSEGNLIVSGTVVFPYNSAQITEVVDDLEVYCYHCGNGVIDPEETKENCCVDVGVAKYSFINLVNEECNNGEFGIVYNWPLISIISLVVLLVVVKVLKSLINLGRARQELNELKRQMNSLETEKESTLNLINKTEKEILNLETSKKQEENEIRKLKEEAKNAAQNVEKQINDEINLRKKRIAEVEKELSGKERNLEEKGAAIKKSDEKLEGLKVELKAKEEDLKKNTKDYYINQQLNLYESRHGGSGKEVIYDKDKKYLFLKYRSGKQISLQRYVYQSNFSDLTSDEEVHHIDTDPLNNEIWNLIALPKEKHNSNYPGHFPHSKVWKKDWLLGYTELKKYLNWKDSDFHEHIRKHYAEEMKK